MIAICIWFVLLFGTLAFLWVTSDPKRIVFDGVSYLTRYFVTPREWRIRVYLHRIHTPDPDRWPHNHPWWFITIPLWGGYQEVVARKPVPFLSWSGEHPLLPDLVNARGNCEVSIQRTWWLVPRFRRADHTHHIFHVRPNTWTLVIAGPWAPGRVWGFRDALGDPSTFVPAEDQS